MNDFLTCLVCISKNPVGTSLVWDWVRTHWKYLVDRYSLDNRNLAEFIPTITKSFTTKTQLKELKGFYQKYPQIGRTIRAKTFENLSNNIRWLSRYTITINDWLLACNKTG